MHSRLYAWGPAVPDQSFAGPFFYMTLVPADYDEMSPVEQHQLLIEEIQAIRTERGFNARTELVLGKYEIGKAIITSPLYSRYTRGVGNLIGQVGEEVGLGWRSIYDCCRFYNAVEVAGGFEAYLDYHGMGKQMSWAQILTLLPQRNADVSEEEEKRLDRAPTPERADRAKAATYAKKRVGEIWRPQDQIRIEQSLGVKI